MCNPSQLLLTSCVFFIHPRGNFSPLILLMSHLQENSSVFSFSPCSWASESNLNIPQTNNGVVLQGKKKSTFQSCTAKIWKCISVYWYSWHEMAWCNGTLFSSSRLFLFHVLRFHIRFYHQTKVVISQQVVRAGRDATACHIMNCVNDTICWHCCF